MATTTVPQPTRGDLLSELGCQLEDVRNVLGLMTPDDGDYRAPLQAGAITAFRLVCAALETLEKAERAPA